MVYDRLIVAIQCELRTHQQDYKPFFMLTQTHFNRLIDNYFHRKQYNSNMGNIIPLATASALLVRIVVISDESDQLLF